jgi:hypothetical protein
MELLNKKRVASVDLIEARIPEDELGFTEPRFAKYPGLQRNVLGREGWLRNLRIAVIDYDSLLYLSAYDS